MSSSGSKKKAAEVAQKALDEVMVQAKINAAYSYPFSWVADFAKAIIKGKREAEEAVVEPEKEASAWCEGEYVPVPDIWSGGDLSNGRGGSGFYMRQDDTFIDTEADGVRISKQLHDQGYRLKDNKDGTHTLTKGDV